MTPLCWAFPLGFAEAFEEIPRDEKGRMVYAEIAPTQRTVMGKHRRLLEHLLKLGANPNIKMTPSNAQGMSIGNTSLRVPRRVFDLREGLSVTHLAAQPIGVAEFNYFPVVMANGGDPNVADGRGLTPIFYACGRPLRLLGRFASSQNVAILVDAGADLERPDHDQCTPILAAAREDHFDVVYVLIHAGADFRAANESGRGLAWYAHTYLRRIQKLSKEKSSSTASHKIEAYYLDVVRFLEDEGLVAKDAYADYKTQLDRAVNESKNLVYADRDPFVEEWVAKRKKALEDKTPSKKTQEPSP